MTPSPSEPTHLDPIQMRIQPKKGAKFLELEDELQEELLQLLVAVVDAELLQRVRLEDLEAVDVEQPDRARACAPRRGRVQRLVLPAVRRVLRRPTG